MRGAFFHGDLLRAGLGAVSSAETASFEKQPGTVH